MADQPHYRVWADPRDGWVNVEKWNPGKNEFATVGRYEPDDGSLIVFMGSKVGTWEYWSGGNKLDVEETNKGTHNAPTRILQSLLPEARNLSGAVKSRNTAPPEEAPLGDDPFAGFDLGGSGSAGPLPPSQQELDNLTAQTNLYNTQAGLLPQEFEETKRASLVDEAQAAADLEAAKRDALADAISSLFDTSVRDADSRRAGAVQTLATTLPIAVSDQDAALLGRMQRGRNNGNPIEVTRVPLDKAALDPTDLAGYQADAEKRARALLGFAKGGVVSKLFRAAAGANVTDEAQAAAQAGDMVTSRAWTQYNLGKGPKPTKSYVAAQSGSGSGTGNGAIDENSVGTDPGGAALLAAQAQAMADFRDYAAQFGVVPQGIIDATLAYYGIPPGSITLPPSLTQQELTQRQFEFTTTTGQRVHEFESTMAHDAAMAAADRSSRERIAANGEANALAIAQGHDNTTLAANRERINADVSISAADRASRETIAQNALRENARQFDTRLAEDQRQFLADAAANPRRVIEAAYYQAGMNPSQAAIAFQNQISGVPGSVPGYPAGVAGQNPTAGGGGQPAGGTPPDPNAGAGAGAGAGAPPPPPPPPPPNTAPPPPPPTTGGGGSQAPFVRTNPTPGPRTARGGTGPQYDQYGRPLASPLVAPRGPIFSHPVAPTPVPTPVPSGGMGGTGGQSSNAYVDAYGRPIAVGAASTSGSNARVDAYGRPIAGAADGVSVAPSIASVVERALLSRMSIGGVVQPSTAFEDRDAKRGNKVPGLHRADAERALSRINKNRKNGIFSAASKGQTVDGPAVILIGEGLEGEGIKAGTHEYLLAPPGTVVAPGKKGETPTMETAMKALRRQVRKSMGTGMRRAASGYMSMLRRAATGTLIETSLIPGLAQGRKGSAFDPLGGATQQLRDVIPDINSLPNYRDYSRQSKTQRGLFESGLSAGRVDPDDVTQFINRGYEGFNPQVGAGQTARVGRFFS